jgi:hypothetical protein
VKVNRGRLIENGLTVRNEIKHRKIKDSVVPSKKKNSVVCLMYDGEESLATPFFCHAFIQP